MERTQKGLIRFALEEEDEEIRNMSFFWEDPVRPNRSDDLISYFVARLMESKEGHYIRVPQESTGTHIFLGFFLFFWDFFFTFRH